MIGAVSNSYTNIQWPSYGNRAKNTAPAVAASPHAQRTANLEIPVQPAKAAVPVNAKATGYVYAGLPLRSAADPAEMAVRARISPMESQEDSAKMVSAQDGGEEAAALLPGLDREENVPAVMGAERENEAALLPSEEAEESLPAVFGAEDEEAAGAVGKKPGQEIQEKLEAEKAERQERAEERIRQQEEAEEKQEKYANELKDKEEARTERLAALRESAGAENGQEETDEEQASPEQVGSLQFDRTAALLRNHQMTNLLNEHLSGQAKGQNTAPIRNAIDALFQNGQQQVRFGEEEDDDRRNAYQQRVNGAVNNPFAAA